MAKKGQKFKKYSPEFKFNVILDMRTNGLSYDLAKKDREKNVKTTLVDIDFNIELIRTDKINVVYILNLLKDVIKKDENEKKRSIDLILREIERSDNERLRAKQEMLKRFVTEKFFSLSPDEDTERSSIPSTSCINNSSSIPSSSKPSFLSSSTISSQSE